MKALEGLHPADAAFDSELATLMREIHEHVAEEKGQVFPHMRTVCSADELVDLRPQQCTLGGLGLPGGHQSAPPASGCSPQTQAGDASRPTAASPHRRPQTRARQ